MAAGSSGDLGHAVLELVIARSAADGASSRSSRWSPTRSALALAVSDGLTAHDSATRSRGAGTVVAAAVVRLDRLTEANQPGRSVDASGLKVPRLLGAGLALRSAYRGSFEVIWTGGAIGDCGRS